MYDYEDDEDDEENYEKFQHLKESVTQMEKSINDFVRVLNQLVVAVKDFRFALAKMQEAYPELQDDDSKTKLLKSSQEIIDSLFKNKPFS